MSMGHPLFLLALVTLLVVLAFAGWTLTSTRRQQKHGEPASGPGGPNDPLK